MVKNNYPGIKPILKLILQQKAGFMSYYHEQKELMVCR